VGDTTFDAADQQASLEATLKGEILRMYEEVANQPNGDFHFFTGREAAELFEYDPELLDRAPPGAVASFAGVGNPHLRSNLSEGETVLDLGSGAGLDSLISAWRVGPTGKVIGLDLNPSMCNRLRTTAEVADTPLECKEGRMEAIPLEDDSVDVIISNGVINLSFQKRKVTRELFQREAAVSEHRQRPQALGLVNRRRSPGGRVVRPARAGGVREGEVCGRATLPLPPPVHAECGRGLRSEGGPGHRREAGVARASLSRPGRFRAPGPSR
jgi:SAM-dependent methyltransferase